MKLYDYEKKHLQQVRKSAGECCVLLKSDGSFPLEKPCQLAAYGSGVRHTVRGGTGSGEVNSHFVINIEGGLRKAGFDLTTTAWLNRMDKVLKKNKKAFIKKMQKEAFQARQMPFVYAMGKAVPAPDYDIKLFVKCDTAIYVVSRDSGEGSDREPVAGDIKLTDAEIRDIITLDKIYKKFMLVLNVGGAIDLSPVNGVRNILLLSQLGAVTGTVLADILLGRQNPSGKLATTWTRWEDYCDIGTFGGPEETLYKEGIYVGYRYFDTVGKKALYPFGFGLSYTTFELSQAQVSVNGSKVSVKTNVTNTGKYAGKEVAQLYVSIPAGKLDQPYQSLAAFAKTDHLKPGQSQDISLDFDMQDLASYDESGQSYILEKGTYLLRLGKHSCDTEVIAGICLSKDVTILQARNCLGKPSFEDWKPEKIAQPIPENIPENIPVYAIEPELFAAKSVVYDQDDQIEEKIQALSEEELVSLTIGYYNPDAKGLSVVGNACRKVSGAAGQTTENLVDKGIPSLSMADGPAGVRLTKDYYMKDDTAIGVGYTGFPESFSDYMPKPLVFLMKKFAGGGKVPADVEIKHQYCTSLPIGTAIAQSFNYELSKVYGDIVGDEMERFGVDLWLAPAMNIHRSIRCGRNFEYYSEDPLVAGLMAAGLTEGVQAHAGRSVTIKHYAANNAETQRYTNNSQVSERALREIYLKGFGICVRKADPHCFMTSYNLLNGTHTAEHRGLIEDVLRAEYGFHGTVMTDWIVDSMVDKKSKYRGTKAVEVAKAGGDLFMPGTKGDYDSVLAALHDGSLSRKQLEINASRIYRTIQGGTGDGSSFHFGTGDR